MKILDNQRVSVVKRFLYQAVQDEANATYYREMQTHPDIGLMSSNLTSNHSIGKRQ